MVSKLSQLQVTEVLIRRQRLVKKMVCFCIAQYPVRWTAQSFLYCSPSLTDLFIPTPTEQGFSGKRSSQAAITRQDKITHISTTVYSQVLIYTAELTRASVERPKMPNLRNGRKGDSNPGSLDCESGIIPVRPLYHWATALHLNMWIIAILWTRRSTEAGF